MESVLDQYYKVPLVKKKLLEIGKYSGHRYRAYRVIVSHALLTLDSKALKLLFSHDIYQKKSPSDLCDGFFFRDEFDIPEPMQIILHFPESKQKEKCIKIFFKYVIYQGIFRFIFQNGLPIEYYSSDISKDKRIEKYVKLCIPFITNSSVFYDFIIDINQFIDVNPKLYEELLAMLLDFGAKIPKYVQTYYPDPRVEKEIKFRNDFFNLDDSGPKNYFIMYNTLRERHQTTMGWWILRILQSRLKKDRKVTNGPGESNAVINNDDMIDTTIHDIKYIPQFCLDEMKRILSNPSAHDKETKKEIVQWKELFFFLDSKLPNAFTDKSQELGMLLLKIVEQGFYQKKSTYKALRPLLEYCLESNTLCPDISIQNGIEGSLIHLLSFFDNNTLRKTIDTYRIKDPALLYYASSYIKPDERFKQETHTTPKDVAHNRLNMCTNPQEKENITETIAILNLIPEVDTNNLDNILQHMEEGYQKKLDELMHKQEKINKEKNEEKLKINKEKLEMIIEQKRQL